MGGGNIGTQFAVHCAEMNADVTIYTSRYQEFKNPLSVVDLDGNIIHEGFIRKATNDVKEAFADADIIFVTVPAQIMREVAKKIEPFAKVGKMIGIIPGAGGSEFAFGNCRDKGAIVFGLQRVPAIARIVTYGKSVMATGYREELFLSAINTENNTECCKIISELFASSCEGMPNYLSILLTPSNSILHTTRLSVIFKEYKRGIRYSRVKLFYREWEDESSELMLRCDEELQRICNKMEDFDLTYAKSLKVHYDVSDAKGLTEKIQSIEGFKSIKTPMVQVKGGWLPEFSSRYFVADFSFGLAILIQIAKFVDVDVPTMRGVYKWFDELGTKCEKFDFAEYGINSYEDLRRFYQE